MLLLNFLTLLLIVRSPKCQLLKVIFSYFIPHSPTSKQPGKKSHKDENKETNQTKMSRQLHYVKSAMKSAQTAKD